MEERDFQARLAELVDRISTLPPAERERLEHMAAAAQHRHQRIRRIAGDLQESIERLRLSVKYLMFDREATRRENHHLRQTLEALRPDDNSDEPP